MPPRFLTCLLGEMPGSAPGMLNTPPIFQARSDVPVRIVDECGAVLGIVVARQHPSQPDGAFLSIPDLAGRLGLLEGFDYLLEPLEPAPPALRSVTLAYKGKAPLARSWAEAAEPLRRAFLDGATHVLEPGRPVFARIDGSIELRPVPSQGPGGPPWLLTPQTQVVVEDAAGPADVIIALDGPASLKKADLAAPTGNSPAQRGGVLAEGVAKCCSELSYSAQGSRVALFTMAEEATPLLFSENGNMTPWMTCSGGEGGKVAASGLIKGILASRLEGDFPPGRNLAHCLKGVIEFIRHQESADSGALTTVILVSDGQYTEGPNPVSVLKEEGQRGLRYVIHVLGTGHDVEEPILKRCAQLGLGTYRRISRTDELISRLTGLAERFQVVVREPGAQGAG